jgi:hypothetical protein
MSGRVISVKSAGAIERFATLEAALVSLEGNPRRHRAEADGERVRNARLVSVGCADDEVVFGTCLGLSLRVFLSRDSVEWSIEDSCVADSAKWDSPGLGEFVLLDWGGAIGVDLWERQALLLRRIGRRIELLSAGRSKVYLYVEGEPILRFVPLIDRSTNRAFLHWCDAQ